ncbi:hypothetical protein [Larkinella harenae]
MRTDAQLIKQWYKAFKENAECATCKHEGLVPQPGKVEFHHIDATSKRDCLSNMAYKPTWDWLEMNRQPVTAISFAIETMKVMPLCPRHHRDLHRAEEMGEVEYLARKYDLLGDPFYQRELSAFRGNVLDTVPGALMPQISEGMLALMEFQQPAFV